jgi:UDP-N-acetylglucosamine/UDP-N-acetylgalactosamine diphosphorylase
MLSVPEELQARLRQYEQEHVLTGWDRLTETERRELIEQLQGLDLEELRQLYMRRDQAVTLPSPERLAPIPVVPLCQVDPQAVQLGQDLLRRGEIAVLLVAGGQGSRLGFEHAKGMFPTGPVSNRSLFQIHAEKILALRRRYGRVIPFLVMTSPATHAETEAYFKDHDFFGLPAHDVSFFCQGTMPALDLETGKLLLEKPGRLFASPNGHGGTLMALAQSGLLDRLRDMGIRQIFYFQVDNPLVKIADPFFLGRHVAADAEVSSKAVAKEGPTDKLGNLVLEDGRCSIIEYSDLPAQLGRETDDQGRLRMWAGSPAIHILAVDFLYRITGGETHLPFHMARKKVPFADETGRVVQPERENALKFEMFIFDVLPLAERWTVVETSRADEFVPLKNATGPDSSATVRQAISNLAASWLEKAGVRVPRRPNGDAAVALEISPLFALDAEELARKIDRSLKIEGPMYLER